MRPAIEPLTPAALLNLILESRADMHLAAFYGGDFITTTANSALVRWRQAHLFERVDRNREAREQYSELVLANSPSIQDVIDSGERSFSEFLKLLDKAQKFKTWLGGCAEFCVNGQSTAGASRPVSKHNEHQETRRTRRTAVWPAG